MPRLDGTGPWACGPRSGWGCGPCNYGWRRMRKIDEKEEKEMLKEEEKYLEEELKAVKDRIKEFNG